MFDNTCKYLAEHFSSDFAAWLLGQSTPLTTLEPTELSVDPIRADAVILLKSSDRILHLEFQTTTDATMPFRMLDYRVRLYRRYPQHQVKQVVLYLKPTDSELAYQTSFRLPTTHHQFRVIRLWEEPPEIFLQNPGLIPFAPLSEATPKIEVLQRAAQTLQQIRTPATQQNLTAATAILAGLVLKQAVIQQVFKKEIMQESVIYQDILSEGLAQGRAEGELALILRQLTHKVGAISDKTESQLRALSLSQLEALGEALLDFRSPEALTQWLSSHS